MTEDRDRLSAALSDMAEAARLAAERAEPALRHLAETINRSQARMAASRGERLHERPQ